MGDVEVTALLEQALEKLNQRPSQRGWIAQFRNGEVLTASEAGYVAAVTPETIRRWCEAADSTDQALGFLIGSLWLVDLPALLRVMEKRGGKHDRLAAEDRAKKLARILSVQQQSLPNLAKATA